MALGQRVSAFERQGHRVQSVRTESGNLPCDAVVIAAGVASPHLGAMLGMKLPIYPIKGYSITVPVLHAEKLARCSITDLGLKTVFAPLGQHLRVAAAAGVTGLSLQGNCPTVRLVTASKIRTSRSFTSMGVRLLMPPLTKGVPGTSVQAMVTLKGPPGVVMALR